MIDRIAAIDPGPFAVVEYAAALWLTIQEVAEEQENNMADRFYGIDRGQDRATVSASTTGLDVEVTVDDAVSLEKVDIINALEIIKKAILEDTGFTAGG